MAVLVENGFSRLTKRINSSFNNRIRLGARGYSQLLFWSFLFCYPSYAYADPTGGNIVGGAGSINYSSLTTTINQTSAAMAINWSSYNLNANEVVNYIQPDASSISLNRIIGGSASQIHGQINANGQVVLVNPNGIFFGSTASVNVGGLIASGLDISPADFMNGDYIFNSVDGTTGAVINGGVLNASLGGSITLLGKQVSNEGLISANLGVVNLAAGHEAVLTFDAEGLMGVHITREILQDELGVDPAILNNGIITAESGRILLTASQSQDVFSQAVNHQGLTQATSVVVNEDGSFTLGAGADVVNTGVVDASSTLSDNQAGNVVLQEDGSFTLSEDGLVVNQGAINASVQTETAEAGKIVLLGENITSSGVIKADAENTNGGDIELHSNDTTLLTENSSTSSRATLNGVGGTVKVLGNHVGLFDQARVDVSGVNGGGQALIGGDYQGNNKQIRNAQRTYVSDQASISSDAYYKGDGGKVIVWADESTQFYGDIFARGGINGGNGGFAEVSGKQGLIYRGHANLTALLGNKGILLLDPKDITISTGGSTDSLPNDYNGFNDISSKITVLNNAELVTQLESADVLLRANNDIFVNDDVIVNTGSSSLNMEAGRSISLADNVDIELNGGSFTATINDEGAQTNNRDTGLATFTMGTNSSITTEGGAITISSGTLNDSGSNGIYDEIGNFTLNTLNSSSVTNATTAGAISVTNSVGNITTNGQISAQGSVGGTDQSGSAGNSISLNSVIGNVTVTKDISSNGGNAGALGTLLATNGGAAGVINITAGRDYTQSAAITAVGGTRLGTGINGASKAITISGDATANIFTFNSGSSFSGLSATITALAGADKIIRTEALTNTWTITGADSGRLAFAGNNLTSPANVIGFTGVESLTGGTGIDNFTINTGGSLVGIIDGGDGANTLTKVDGTNIWALTGIQQGNLTNTGGFINIQTLNGGSGSDTLVNYNTASDWVINNGGNNTLVDRLGDNSDMITFSNFENVTGGNDTDKFIVNSRTEISGVYSGGGGADDEIDLSNLTTPVTVQISLLDTVNITVNDFDIITANPNLSFDNKLIGDNRPVNAWNVTGLNSGDVNGTDFSGFSSLEGGNQIDNFVLSGGILTGTINGGSGIDSLTGDNVLNTWTITDLNEGNVTGVDLFNTENYDFTGIENLIGNGSTDNFTLDGGTLSGTIDGGGGTDTLTGDRELNTWVVTALNEGNVTGVDTGNTNVNYDFTGIENLIGNDLTDNFSLAGGGTLTGTIDGAGGNDTLTGDNVLNTWVVTATNEGNVTGVDTANSNGGYDFTGIESLIGNGDTDNFSLTGGGTLSGTIDGAGGFDTLTGDNVLNTWSVTAANQGNVTGVDTANLNTGYDFTGIENLIGNDAIDNFSLAGGTLSGTIDGRGGNDTLTGGNVANTWTVTGVNEGSVDGVDTGNSNASYDFTGIESLTGNALTDDFLLVGGTLTGTIDGAGGYDTLTGDNVLNTWSVTGANQGDATGVNTGSINASYGFTGIESLIGNGATDNFKLAGGTLSGTIDGAGGDDTLTGNDTASTWTVNEANEGNVTGVDTGNSNANYDFTGIEYLFGGSNNDAFNFINNGSISGFINGGGQVVSTVGDTLNIALMSGAIEVVIGATPLSSTAINIVDIEQVTGNGTDSTLTGQEVLGVNTVNYWSLFDNNVGGTVVNDGTVTNENGEVKFINFGHLVGSNRDDVFSQSTQGLLSLTIDGGGQQTNDRLDFSNLNDVLINQNDAAINTITRVEVIVGNNTSSTLIAKDGQTNNWVINGNNDGTLNVNDAANRVLFVDFNILVGGDEIDIFDIQNNGSIGDQSSPATDTVSGISGGAGEDTLTTNFTNTEVSHLRFNGGDDIDSVVVNLNGNQNGSITFDGGIDDDTLLLQGGISTYTGVYSPVSAISNQLAYTNGANVYAVNYSNINDGTVNDNVTAQSLAVNGTASGANTVDTINLNTGSFSVNSNTPVDYTGKVDLLVDGLDGIDTININSAINHVSGRVYLAAENIGNISGDTYFLSANELVIDSANAVGSDTNTLRTNVTNLRLINVNGSVYLENENNLSINDLTNTTGTLDITNKSGNITDNGDLISSANLNLTSTTGIIGLDSTNNQLTGDVSLDATQVNFTNNAITRLNNITATVLDVVSTGGEIIDVDTGVINVDTATFSSVGAITLDSGNVNISTLDIDSATDMTVNNGVNALDIVDVTASGVVTIDSGLLTATGTLTGSEINLNSAGASTTVNGINTGGALNITSAGLTLNGILNANSALLDATTGDVNINNAITINAGDLIVNGNNILQNAGITLQSGNASLTAAGSLSMDAAASTTASAGDIQYNATGNVQVSSLTAANGTLGINTTGGSIVDNNDAAMNFTANTLQLRAVNGIGYLNEIETQVAVMDIINTGTNGVDIKQTGSVELVALQNTGSSGDIFYLSNDDINFNPGSVVANRATGNLVMRTTRGSFLGLGAADLSNPDITAQNATFFGPSGTFGTFQRHLVLDVPGSVLIDTRASFNPEFLAPGPSSLETRGIDFSILGAVSAVAGEQLVEVESLGEIDAAIFTDLHNYSLEDVSIRMPRDQLFDDELEAYDRF